jgi:GrpB-like predicted nucleotidyltransferase (UPF0157 family)
MKAPFRDSVELSPYDSDWPKLFEMEAQRLRTILPQAGRIEHFGSTAVVGLKAKPVIDILLEVDDPTAPHVQEALEQAGYHWYWRTDREPHYPFCVKFAEDGHRTHHVHVHRGDSGFWERLLFRDLLRVDQEERSAYQQFKETAAAAHKGDREAYTDAKAGFVAAAMKRARERFKVE